MFDAGSDQGQFKSLLLRHRGRRNASPTSLCQTSSAGQKPIYAGGMTILICQTHMLKGFVAQSLTAWYYLHNIQTRFTCCDI